MKGWKFQKFVGGAWINGIGVALYTSASDNSHVRLRSETTGGKSLITRDISAAEFEALEEQWRAGEFEIAKNARIAQRAIDWINRREDYERRRAAEDAAWRGT